MAYKVGFRPSAAKEFRRLEHKIQKRIAAALTLLELEPRSPGCKKLKGSDYYRVRVGTYRVIYEVTDGQLIVLVIRIAHRREVY